MSGKSRLAKYKAIHYIPIVRINKEETFEFFNAIFLQKWPPKYLHAQTILI